jgi:two-component system, NtrC family, C4-dicarboxylate transport sensor histidine kinase DctB
MGWARRSRRYEPVPPLLAEAAAIRALLADPGSPKKVEVANQLPGRLNTGLASAVVYLLDARGLALAASNYDQSINL